MVVVAMLLLLLLGGRVGGVRSGSPTRLGGGGLSSGSGRRGSGGPLRLRLSAGGLNLSPRTRRKSSLLRLENLKAKAVDLGSLSPRRASASLYPAPVLQSGGKEEEKQRTTYINEAPSHLGALWRLPLVSLLPLRLKVLLLLLLLPTRPGRPIRILLHLLLLGRDVLGRLPLPLLLPLQFRRRRRAPPRPHPFLSLQSLVQQSLYHTLHPVHFLAEEVEVVPQFADDLG